MFASADMFDDEEVDSPRDTHGDLSSPTQEALVSSGSDGRRPHSSSISVSVSQMSRPSTTQQMSELRMGGDEKDDDNLNPVSPAARKAKMAELREQQLAKRKGKGATSGILQKNDAPKIDRPLSTSSVASPTSPANATKSPTSASNPNILPVAPLPVSPTSSSAFSRTMSPRDGDAVVADSSSINAFLAERKAEKDQKQMSAVERDMLAHGITPVFDPVKKPPVGGGATANVKFDFSDMRNFLTTSAPKGITVQCSIVRQKKGLMNKMYPLYELYLDEGNRFLLAAKKRTKNKTSNYVMSMDKKNLTKESASYLGKVRSNFVGTEFVAYDKGINPKDVDDESASISLMTVRQELCGVFYESNILGSRGPRKMTALVPAVRKDGTRAIWRPLTATDSITAKYKEGQTNDIMCLQNKTPKWNDQVGAYVLNFNGRVTMASVKNFQLITADDPENVLLQFGRVGKDTFTMDFAYPISPLQAFAICLSSFDYKLACE